MLSKLSKNATPLPHSLCVPGVNCWRIEQATYATVLIDCANYYRALHEAICKARHSIFVLGWDIDSRIALIRDKDAQQSLCPSRFFDLIQWKVSQNPNLNVYLNRWDYSIYQAADREGLHDIRWRLYSSPNVHYCLDGVIPLGASHHQKVVVIDDEIAFSGGMDIALGRWDLREHYVENSNRIDPPGAYDLKSCRTFGPYHDIQMMVAGPAAQALGVLVRDRWHSANGYQPVPLRAPDYQGLPPSWPDSFTPDFKNVSVGVALTEPPMYGMEAVRQVEQLYLDMIASAERFIYIENQFFTQKPIAAALNKQLQQKPDLRVLLLSCYDPEGIMERKSMWYGRVLFREIVEAGGVKDRVVMAYPITQEGRKECPVRVHSKTMIVDDRYLRVGSSNINNRSMAFDTECDLVIEGTNEKTCKRIAAIRADLIREHTGREIEEIEHIIHAGSVQDFLKEVPYSRQHMRNINDEAYRHESFAHMVVRLADPDKPIVPGELTMPYRYTGMKSSLPMRLMGGMCLIMLLIGCALLWRYTPLSSYATPEEVVRIVKQLRELPFAIPSVIALFVIGGLVFFPVTLLIAATALAFPSPTACFIALSGALLSASSGFLIGRVVGMKGLSALLGLHAPRVLHYTKKGGIVGITLLRMVPIAPFMAVNLALGIARVPFLHFLVGTALGLLPGVLAWSLLGDAVTDVFSHMDFEHFSYLVAGGCLWVAIIVFSHYGVRSIFAHKA